MSSEKKRIRQSFRDAVFERDCRACRVCGRTNLPLDAHHIIDRTLMPGGGYVASNGISLCPKCHEKAEQFHSTGEAISGFSPEELYAMISSSHERAKRDSERL